MQKTFIQTDRERQIGTWGQMIERQTNRQKHSDTNQLADGQIARQTNRQTDKETLLLYYGSTMCVTTIQYCKKARLELYSTVHLNHQLTDVEGTTLAQSTAGYVSD